MPRLPSSGVLLLLGTLALPSPLVAHEALGRQLARLEAALEQTPTDARLHLKRVRLLRRAGRHPEAWEALARAAARAVAHPELELERAMVACALERDAEARVSFERTEKRGLRTAESEALRSRLLLRRGESGAAIEALERSVSLEPTPDRLLTLARLQQSRGQASAARVTLRRGLEVLGPAEILTRALVESLLAGGLFAEALERIDAELALRPERPGWRRLRAEALRGLGRGPAADRALEQALKLAEAAARRRPTRPHLLELARIHHLRGERREARGLLLRVHDQTPTDPELRALAARWKVQLSAPGGE